MSNKYVHPLLWKIQKRLNSKPQPQLFLHNILQKNNETLYNKVFHAYNNILLTFIQVLAEQIKLKTISDTKVSQLLTIYSIHFHSLRKSILHSQKYE